MSDADEIRRICEAYDHEIYEEPTDEDGPDARDTPVGAEGRKIRQGECMSSIAHRSGHVWETIWNHSKNSDMKRARKNPNVLLPGDRVFVPDIRLKQESRATEKKHKFRRLGVPAEVEVFFLDSWEPMADVEYTACVDRGEEIAGNLDSKGGLKVPVSPSAKRLDVTLTLEDGTTQQHRFELGCMNPVSDPSGYRRRLHQLGLLVSPFAAEDIVADALQIFQEREGLDVTGKANEKTLDALRKQNGS